jgi:hypothetical protein
LRVLNIIHPPTTMADPSADTHAAGLHAQNAAAFADGGRAHAEPAAHATLPPTADADVTPSDRAAADNINQEDHLNALDEKALTRISSGVVTEADFQYPPLRTAVVAFSALCLAIFLVALDQTIISTAIPKITDQVRN